MKREIDIEQLLRWRMERAEAGAPLAPRAAHLLDIARPWWETWPDRFQTLVERLSRIQIAYGHAMAEPSHARGGHPVATLIVHREMPLDTSARVLYIEVRDGRLRLRFQLDQAACQGQPAFEATFISETNATALFVVQAVRSVDSEYRVEGELPEEVARGWTGVKVTDRMPFRLILKSPNDNS